jgi:uncharacterized protein YyaL (SSP411 family)
LSPEQEDRLADLRARLLTAREARIEPGWDDKVLADWNGLMIAALVNAARVFDRPDWLTLARRAFDAIVAGMSTADGRLYHASRAGQAKAPATASDYAAMIWAALRLYAASGNSADLDRAAAWTLILDRHYWHPDAGGYCLAADDTPDVIVRLRSASDDATPNANALMISNLAHLSLLTGDQRFMDRAGAIPTAFAADLQRNLVEHCGLLAAAHDLIAPSHVLISVPGSGVDATRMIEALRSLALPGALEQVVESGGAITSASITVAAKTAAGDRPTAYICIGTQCSAPIADPDALTRELRVARSAARGG